MNSNMKLIFSSLLLTILLSVSLSSSYSFALSVDIGKPFTQIHTVEDYNGHTQNWNATIGADGTLYVANGNGVIQWNGAYWKMYNTPNNTRVRDLFKWRDDKIYFGTTNDIGRLEQGDKGELSYQSLLTDAMRNEQFGNIWSIAGTSDGIAFVSSTKLFTFDGSRFKTIPNFEPGSNRLFNLNRSLFIFVPNKGLHKIHLGDNPSAEPLIWPKGLPVDVLVRDLIKLDEKRSLIITSFNGIYVWSDDQAEQVFSSSHLMSGEMIYSGLRDENGFIYLGGIKNGLYIIAPDYSLLKRYGKADGIGTNTITNILEDNQGGIWLVGAAAITSLVPPHKYSKYADEEIATGGNNIVEYKSQPLIAGFSLFRIIDGGLDKLDNWDRETWSILEIDDGVLVASSGGIFYLQIDSQFKAHSIKHIAPVQFALDIANDPISEGVYYATTSNGVLRIKRNGKNWSWVEIEGIEDSTQNLKIDSSGVVWVGTSHQYLYRFKGASDAGIPNELYRYDEHNGLGNDNVIVFQIDSGIVFGTKDGLVQAGKELGILAVVDDLPSIFNTSNHDVFRMHEDYQGNLWARIGESTGVALKSKNKIWDDGLFNVLPDRSVIGIYRTLDGRVWVLHADGGVYSVDPQYIQALPPVSPFAIRDVVDRTSNETLLLINKENLQLKLDELHQRVRIKFSLADFSLFDSITYRSRIVDNGIGWSDWSDEYWFDYNADAGGTRLLEVQARDGWGRLSGIIPLKIVVPYPWYLGHWAIIAYIIIAISLLLLAALIGQRWRTARLAEHNKELEAEVISRTAKIRAQADKLLEQQTLKDRFFANVSHEFRTPLTLTIEPLREVIQESEDELKPKTKELINTALRSSQQMLDLVGQVLDINRLESGAMALRVSEYDLAELLRRLTQRFLPWVEREKQTIDLKDCEEPEFIYYDEDQISQVISNLISNAIKYSGQGSHIKISLSTSNNFAIVEVKDDGPGIIESQQKEIFERYFQGESSINVTHPGTGIGLSLVKDLVELHHGKIELKSIAGQGACFTLRLLKGNVHFLDKELIQPLELNESSAKQITKDEENSIMKNSSTNSRTLLVVDDNDELRRFLMMRLSTAFHVEEANNGQEGLERTKQLLPDLIISDISMPVMDGLEMITEIKAHPETRDIPIILLSAKTTKRDTVQGFQVGADDYLIKPFDTSELVVRVNRLLSKQDELRKALHAKKQLVQLPAGSKASFEERLDLVIGKHLTNPELNMSQLADELAMSRATLYRKIQQTKGLGAAGYIKQERLKLAHELISRGEGKVGEVAYACGFENLSSFSRDYKSHFGVSPSTHIPTE